MWPSQNIWTLIKCLHFILFAHFFEPRKFFIRFLEEFRTPQFRFEIFWHSVNIGTLKFPHSEFEFHTFFVLSGKDGQNYARSQTTFRRLTNIFSISLERVHYSPQDWNFTTNWMRAPSLHMFKQLKGKKCSIFSKIVSINSMVCKLADVKTFWLKLKTKWREPLCIYLLKRFRYVKLEMYISVSQVIEFPLWGVKIKLNILQGNYCILWIMPNFTR